MLYLGNWDIYPGVNPGVKTRGNYPRVMGYFLPLSFLIFL